MSPASPSLLNSWLSSDRPKMISQCRLYQWHSSDRKMMSVVRHCCAAGSDWHQDIIFGPSLLRQSFSTDGQAGDVTEARRYCALLYNCYVTGRAIPSSSSPSYVHSAHATLSIRWPRKFEKEGGGGFEFIFILGFGYRR
jgi:hypothetical protein